MASKLVQQTPTAVEEEEDQEEEAWALASQLVGAAAFPMSLKVAIELGLLEHIASAGPGAELSPDDLAALINAQNPGASSMIDRILRLLSSYSILTSTTHSADGRIVRRYGATPVCKYLNPVKGGASLATPLLLCHDKVTMENWGYVKEAVLNGGVPMSMAHGGLSEFEYHEKDPRYGKLFNEGMRCHSIITLRKILEKYRGFDGIGVLVDAGGGVGSALSMITAVHPQIKGINFDIPHVIAQVPPLPGVEHVSGDIFSSIPKGDAILMKRVLHGWNDEDCLRILKNCWKALPERGKVIILELILPETAENSRSAQVVGQLDMMMLLESCGGKERTEKEFKDLAMQSGFTEFKVICCFFCTWIIEFIK